MSLVTSHFLPFDREEVWAWHTRRGAITRLSPPFLPMTPTKQAERLSDGTTVLSMPAGLKWISRHDLTGYRRGHEFVDVCTSAPMKLLATWRHIHRFEDFELDGNMGTLITDDVTTRLPMATLKPMFAYRQHQLLEDMLAEARVRRFAPNYRPLTVAITGSRGVVGRALTAQLTTTGHQVIQLVRGEAKPGQRQWNPKFPDPDLLEDVDVLVHLAGEPLVGRFSDSHKRSIKDSRVGPTSKLAELVATSARCHTFVCASAIGFYGHDRGEEPLTESTEQGDGFLAQVVADWEAATGPATDAGKRVINVRTGVALSGRGGVLPIFRTLFSTGLGGNFGDGNQWLSWISIDDLTDIYIRAIHDETLSGPINAVAPQAVQNREFTRALAKELKRPAVFPIPTVGPKLVLGRQGAEELALADQNVVPDTLTAKGHHFRYPSISTALAHELGGEKLFDVKPDPSGTPVLGEAVAGDAGGSRAASDLAAREAEGASETDKSAGTEPA